MSSPAAVAMTTETETPLMTAADCLIWFSCFQPKLKRFRRVTMSVYIHLIRCGSFLCSSSCLAASNDSHVYLSSLIIKSFDFLLEVKLISLHRDVFIILFYFDSFYLHISHVHQFIFCFFICIFYLFIHLSFLFI